MSPEGKKKKVYCCAEQAPTASIEAVNLVLVFRQVRCMMPSHYSSNSGDTVVCKSSSTGYALSQNGYVWKYFCSFILLRFGVEGIQEALPATREVGRRRNIPEKPYSECMFELLKATPYYSAVTILR